MASVEKWDVVVVGGASAGIEAAISAHQGGARRVLVLEKAPEGEFGGNARFSHTGFRFPHSGASEIRIFDRELPDELVAQMHIPAYTEDFFREDLVGVTEGRIDAALADCLVTQGNSAVHWLREIGVEWEIEKPVKVGDTYYFARGINIHPKGGGVGLTDALRNIALSKGIEMRFDSKVRELRGNERKVTGVLVSSPGREYEIEAPAIILCSGGFQASTEMRARYLGRNADLMKVRGSKHNTGEILQMAMALGALTTGQWQGAHMTPIDGKAPDFETPIKADGRTNKMNRYEYPQGITINALGQRFFDEGENENSYTYAKTGRAVLQQPGGIAFQLFDQKGIRLFRDGPDIPATVFEADTMEALAEKIGIEPHLLANTVNEFNSACRTDVEFDRSKLDGKCTVGITPRKSNWAEPLTEPPFRAYPVTGGITFTFGGLKIDTQGQVLNTSHRPIEGLFASGDIVGLFFHNYPACSGQTRNAVFSRAAGRRAAELCA